MIIDLYDAVDAMATALFVWFVIGAVVATLGGLLLGWAVSRAWRAVRGPCGASGGPEVAPDAGEAPEASQGPSSDSSYEEAA